MKAQRNARLRREVRQAMKELRGRSPEEVLDRVLSRPLTRGFYLGADSVVVMERRRRNSGVAPAKGDRRAAMWADLFGQIDALLSSQPRLSRIEAICRVLATGTSHHGFCISRALARKIIKLR